MLSVEQEILRVHGRAARALANQLLPFSVCTILKDDEVYNIMTPEQEEEKDRHARSRYNGRLFLSWLQDVDDKWEKIKVRNVINFINDGELFLKLFMIFKGINVIKTSQRGRESTRSTKNGLGMEIKRIAVMYLQFRA